MPRFFPIFAASLTGALLLANAPAAAAAGWVDRHQQGQWERMAHQYRDGNLSEGEFWRLARNERWIDGYQRQAWADGRLGWRERRDLGWMLDRQSRAIYNQAHD